MSGPDQTSHTGAGPARGRGVAIAIFLLALLLRLVWVGIAHNDPHVGDASWYDARAVSVVSGQGYSFNGIPTAYFPPGYPLFLAGLYSVAGHHIALAKVANAVLGALTALLVFVLARRLFGPRTAVIAGLLAALHPNAIVFSSLLMSETLLATLLVALLAVLASPAPLTARALLAAGALLGLACLVKAAALIVPLALLLYWTFAAPLPLPRVLRALALLLVGCAVVLAPWALRNRLVMHHAVLVSTNGGINFWMSQASGGYLEPPPDLAMGWGQTSSPDEEVAAEHRAYRAGLAAVKQSPALPLLRLPKKLVRFFYADIDGLLSNSGNPAVGGPRDILGVAGRLPVPLAAPLKVGLYGWAEAFYLGLLLLALVGVARCLRAGHAPSLLLLMVLAAWVAVHTLLFFPSGRYRLPVMPIVIVFAAAAVAPPGRRPAERGRA